MAEFHMPSLGADMDEGMVVEWLVSPGDEVHRGDLVASVETQKGIIDIEIWEDCVIEGFLVDLGVVVPVGTPIARVSTIGAEEPEAAPAEAAAAPEALEEEIAPEMPETIERVAAAIPPPPVRHLAHQLGVDVREIEGTGPEGTITRDDVRRAAEGPARERVPATPLARRTAESLGVDLSRVRGSGPGGAVVAADVAAGEVGAPVAPSDRPVRPAEPAARAPEAARPAPSGGDADAKQAAMRQAIAKLMARSKREIPHYYLGHTIDMTTALEWLGAENAARPVTERVLPAVLMLKATALATRAVPEMNGFWTEDGLEKADGVNLGVAISLRGGGLIAPAIHDADALTLLELMASLRDLVKRTRAMRLRGSEMTGGTITVTNLGDNGVEEVYGVIYPPQVALVGFGRIVERPWAVNGLIGVRSVVRVTLAADHRAGDGHTGGLFLAEIERLLQKPEEL